MSATIRERDVRLHPLNQNFVWTDNAPAAARRLSPEERGAFNAHGYVKLTGIFDLDEIEEVIAAIDPLEAEGEEHLRRKGGTVSIATADVITFTTHIVRKSETLRSFAAHAALKEICHDLIGEDVRLYWDQSVYKKTGKKQEFPWHQDNGYTFIEPQQYLTLWIPLVDVDVENGCPWIAPGLHKMGTLDHWVTPVGFKCLEHAPDAVAIPARAGDVIAFSSLTPHRTGPNLKSGTVRKAYILQYAPDGAYTLRNGVKTLQNDPERQFKILERGQ